MCSSIIFAESCLQNFLHVVQWCILLNLESFLVVVWMNLFKTFNNYLYIVVWYCMISLLICVVLSLYVLEKNWATVYSCISIMCMSHGIVLFFYIDFCFCTSFLFSLLGFRSICRLHNAIYSNFIYSADIRTISTHTISKSFNL